LCHIIWKLLHQYFLINNKHCFNLTSKNYYIDLIFLLLLFIFIFINIKIYFFNNYITLKIIVSNESQNNLNFLLNLCVLYFFLSSKYITDFNILKYIRKEFCSHVYIIPHCRWRCERLNQR